MGDAEQARGNSDAEQARGNGDAEQARENGDAEQTRESSDAGFRMSAPRLSPLAGRRPTRADLRAFAASPQDALVDVLPDPSRGQVLRLLIVGINPGLWTAAVNAPFARPGNRFWPSLHRAGLTTRRVDAASGLDEEDEEDLRERGIGITNLVGRATARADQLSTAELRAAGEELSRRVAALRPTAVAIAGITAFRTAFEARKAQVGIQDPHTIPHWPQDVALWVVPQPSGLNAHATVETLAATWRDVARSAGVPHHPEDS